MLDPITLLSVGAGLAQSAFGFVQKEKGKQRAKMNIREDYKIPNSVYDNLGMWEQMGQRGLPENSLEFINQNAIRGLSQSLSTGLQLGASPNSVNDYYQSYLDKLGEIGVKDAQQRFSNLNNLSNAREALANQQFIKFGFKDSKWKDEAQLSAMEQTQGMQNIFGGADTALSGIVSGKNRQLYQKQIDYNEKVLGINQPVNTGVAETVPTAGNIPIDPGSFGATSGKFADPYKANGGGYISNYLKKNGISNTDNNANEYFWQKYAGENPQWWLTPGERKYKFQ